MSYKTYIRELPLDIPVTLCVEEVMKRDEEDNFRLECRVVDGEQIGNLIRLYFYREKKAGGPNAATAALLEILNPGESAPEIPSWKLQGKIFKCTPWHPEKSRYQMYGRFKYVGQNDVF